MNFPRCNRREFLWAAGMATIGFPLVSRSASPPEPSVGSRLRWRMLNVTPGAGTDVADLHILDLPSGARIAIDLAKLVMHRASACDGCSSSGWIASICS